jgi:tripartite-type tricarboxylate transporter receptor subunit TctC
MVRFILSLALIALAPLPASAQGDWPTKPIRFIVSFPPGGSSDLVARAVAPSMSERLGQPVVIDNRPGAGGTIGVDLVAKAPPDGYTIGLGAAGALAANLSLFAKLPYDPLTDLAPVVELALIPFFLVAHPSVPATSLKDLLAAAKARPGTLFVAHGGAGTAMHLSGELLKLMTAADLPLVAYKGSGPAAQDVLSGQVALAVLDITSSIEHVRAGKLKALGVTSDKRSRAAPEVPTFAEAGVAGYEATGWFGVVAPAGTPEPVIRRLNAEFRRALDDPQLRERMIALGCEPAAGTPEEFGARIRSEIPKWADVVKRSGTKLE